MQRKVSLMWKSVWQLQKKYCVLHLNKNSVAQICRPCLDSISKQLFTFNSLEQSLNGEWKKKYRICNNFKHLFKNKIIPNAFRLQRKFIQAKFTGFTMILHPLVSLAFFYGCSEHCSKGSHICDFHVLLFLDTAELESRTATDYESQN